MTINTRRIRCKARTKAGKPCGAAATAGGLCFFHANPNKASELGRIGGRSKRRPLPGSVDPLPKLDNAMAVRKTVAQLIEDVYSGRLDTRVAMALTPLLNLQLRAIETTDVERRLEEWGKQSEGDQTNTGLKQRQNEVLQANESTEPAKPLSDMASDTA
jgi:hypothetical protein